MYLKVETRAKQKAQCVPADKAGKRKEVYKMKKEIFCSVCGRKFIPMGREHICPSCKQEAAAAAKKAAVERAKARSYTGEACPVRISARARGFIEAIAAEQGCKFIPALDAVLKKVAANYGFQSWEDVPEHRTERRASKAAKVAAVTPAETPAKPAETPAKASKANTPSKASKATSKASKTSKA